MGPYSIYYEMLKEVGITAENLIINQTDVFDEPIPNPVCKACKSEPLTLWQDGYLTCHECGLVNKDERQYDHTCVPGYYKIESSKACNGTHFEKKRSYKPITHFKEHMRRYMGARFTPIPDKLLQDLVDMKVDHLSPNAFFEVKKALKKLKYNDYYKEIFHIIYKLGGQAPVIPDEVFHECVNAYQALMLAFERKKKEWKRHSMPSNYVVLDMLLRHFGHVPYYNIPMLKDDDLQLKVQSMIQELKDYWKFSPNINKPI